MGAGGRWQDITHFISIRVHRQIKESRNLQIDRRPHILGDKIPVADKERRGKPRIFCIYMYAFAHCALIIIQLALQRRSSHHVPLPWHVWFKLNEDRNPSKPWENWAGMKVREVSLQTLPPLVTILSFYLYVLHNRLAKEAPCISSSPVCPLSLREHILDYLKFHFTFLSSLLHLQILLQWRNNFKFTTNNIGKRKRKKLKKNDEVMAESLLNLKETDIQVQEAQKAPTQRNWHKDIS